MEMMFFQIQNVQRPPRNYWNIVSTFTFWLLLTRNIRNCLISSLLPMEQPGPRPPTLTSMVISVKLRKIWIVKLSLNSSIMINYEMGLRLDPQLFPKIITRTARVAFRFKFRLEYYGQSFIMYKSAFANKFIRNTHCRVHASHKNLMMLAFVVTQTTPVSHKIIKQFGLCSQNTLKGGFQSSICCICPSRKIYILESINS